MAQPNMRIKGPYDTEQSHKGEITPFSLSAPGGLRDSHILHRPALAPMSGKDYHGGTEITEKAKAEKPLEFHKFFSL